MCTIFENTIRIQMLLHYNLESDDLECEIFSEAFQRVHSKVNEFYKIVYRKLDI